MQLRSRRAAFLAGASGLSLLLAAPALAQNINTMGSWNGTSFISSWGEPNTATYGQTITTTASQRTIRNFTFQLNQQAGTAPNYTAHVYAWDSVNNRLTGSALFNSGVLTAPTTGAGVYQTVSIDTGATALAVGQQYVLFLTTSTQGVQPNATYRYGSLTNNTTYTGGQFVFQNNSDNFGNLSAVAWSNIPQDLAFTATFNNPIDTNAAFYLSSALGVDLDPIFQGGTLRLDTTSVTQNFDVQAVAGNTIDSNGQNATFSGVLSGTGGLTKAGAGTVTFSGANTFTGGMTISAGSITFTGGAAFSDTATLTVNSGLTVAAAETVGSLDGTGTVTLNAALTAGGNNSSTTFGGVLAGTGGFTKTGNGVMQLTGANTHTGGTTVSGSLQVGAGGASGSITGNVVVNIGSSLVFNRSGSLTYTGVISGFGSLAKLGTGTTILTGTNTYTGGTTINAGTLQIGAGGTVGSIAGDVAVNNIATLSFDRSDNILYADIVSGTGSVTKSGAGALILSNANTYTGGTTVSAGTLQVGNGGATGSIAGNVSLGSGTTLFFNRSNNIVYAGSVSGAGALVKSGAGFLTVTGDLTHTGGTTVNGGTLSIGAFNASGSLAGDVVLVSSSSSLLFSRTSITYAGVISGAGSLTASGGGTLTLTGNSSHTGGTLVQAGSSLQLGNGGTTGGVSGNIVNDGALIVNRSDTINTATVVSGIGSVTKRGTGLLNLTGASTYTSFTNVVVGTLAVNGSIAASSGVTVFTGATLGGSGTVAATTINSGATLAPGNSVGTLTVHGNLTLQAGSTYAAEISPTAADRVNVTGTTSIAGDLVASFQSGGGYVSPSSFTLVSSTGALSGTFASFSMLGLPAGYRASLTYSASTVSLQLQRVELLPLLGGGTVNQAGVAGGIDRAVLAGANPSASFQPLYNMSGTTLGAALNQLDGQINAQVAEGISSNYFAFLRLLMGEGGSGGNGASASFAPGKTYAAADAPKPAQLTPGELNVWGAVFGGTAGISADAATGAQAMDSSGYRFAAGLSYAADEGLLLGAGIAAGQDNFDSGNGKARGGDLSLGFHARQSVFDGGYLSAALGFGWTSVKTTRIVTISGTDVLQGKPDADTIGGRVEGGYRFALDESADLTPFAALAVAGFDTPAYAETALAGSNAFALSYQARSSLIGNTELGARLGRSFTWDGNPGRIELVAGWAYSVNDAAVSNAAFQSLAGSSFQLLGVNQAKNSAILGVNLEGRTSFGLDYGLRLDSRVGDGSSVLTGTGRIGWHL